MDLLLELLQQPFFQRSLIAGFVVAVLTASLGVFVVLRKMSFFGEGVAHASLAGVAIGLLASVHTLPTAMAFAVCVSLAIFFLERYSKLASDTVIGILFSMSMAFGLVLLGFFQGYTPDLLTFLFGNVLSVSLTDVFVTIGAGAAILLAVLLLYPQLVFSTFDRDAAHLSGVRTLWIDIFLHVVLAVVIVLSVKLVGIVLVSALLVIPAATSILAARTFLGTVIGSVCLSVFSVMLGLALSVFLNVASGAMIVLVSGVIFLGVLVAKRLIQLVRKRRMTLEEASHSHSQ